MLAAMAQLMSPVAASAAGATDSPAPCHATMSLLSNPVIASAQLRLPIALSWDCIEPTFRLQFSRPGILPWWEAITCGGSCVFDAAYPEPGRWAVRLDPTYSDGDDRDQLITPIVLAPASTFVRCLAWDFIATSRKGAAVYVNGISHRVMPGIPNPYPDVRRTMYLQRYLNGHWQNMLSRVTDFHGAVTVGFIARTAAQYRWLTVQNDITVGSHSAIAVR